MRLRLLTIHSKLPAWVKEGYEDYRKRFPATFPLELIEIPAEKHSARMSIADIKKRESEKLIKMTKPEHRVIALDVKGELWSTEKLAAHLSDWQQEGKPLDFWIGGPDGIDKTFLEKADHRWSLSPLTFPHFLVRIILVEQLYRAISILQNHPYHRAG